MNIYHIEVISSSVRTKRDVEAEGISWSDSGLYEFWKTNEDGKRIAVAQYPVSKTIIESIEYN